MSLNKQRGTLRASKVHGRIYTPDFLVRIMLDFVGYTDAKSILSRHIIDNSCGDGAFLCEIVQRYCAAFISSHPKWSLQAAREALRGHLAKFIHGIEIDATEREKCIQNLNAVIARWGISEVEWDVLCADALTVSAFDGAMDYVVGNPPYVRVHNLQEQYKNVKQYALAQNGMTDLYLVFMEICWRMSAKRGKVCVITPSSWLQSKAGQELRKQINKRQNLSGVIELGHFQPFSAATYTLISRFDHYKHDAIEYYTLDENGTHLVAAALRYKEMFIDSQIFLSEPETLEKLREIRGDVLLRRAMVKNGFATLADKIFIGDFPAEEFTIPVIKASTGQWRRCIFPYDAYGKLVDEPTLYTSPWVFDYLKSHKEDLVQGRSIEKHAKWYAFGRSQAILDVSRHKYSINTLIKDVESIRLVEVPAGSGVYSGLYILTHLAFQQLQDILLTDDFVQYVHALKNYKSGGYYTFSSRDLELFINYKISKNDE